MISHRMTHEDKGREPVPDGSRPGGRRRALRLALLLALPLVTTGCGLVQTGLDAKAQEVHRLWFIILCVLFNVWMDRHTVQSLEGSLRFRMKPLHGEDE